MKNLMASQFSITGHPQIQIFCLASAVAPPGNRALLHICVNNWRLVWEASKVEKQQAQQVQELTGKLRQMDKDTNEFVNRTKARPVEGFGSLYTQAKDRSLF